MKRLLVPLLSLAILGAGCAAAPSAPSQTPPSGTGTSAPAPKPTPAPSPAPTPAPSSGETRALSPAATDASWHTYANAALGFSFMTPTKGRYAPEWEVKVFKDTDAEVTGGCFAVAGGQVAEPARVTVGAQAFCHTSANEGAAGSIYFTDAYATPFGHAIAVILFTKRVYSAGAIPNCADQEFSSSSNACTPFVKADYQAALDGIVGTFQLTK